MKRILLTALLLVFGVVAIASADTFTPPIVNFDTKTVTYEGHAYTRDKTADTVHGTTGMTIFVAIYKSEDNGDIMSISKCEDCLPFSWLIVHDKDHISLMHEFISNDNYELIDTNGDGIFDLKRVGKDISVYRPPADCLLEEGNVYSNRKSI